MIDILFQYAAEAFGLLITMGVIVGILLVRGIWTTSAKYALKKQKLDNLPCQNHADELRVLNETKSKVDGLPCEKHSANIDNLSEAVVGIRETLGELRGEIKGIKGEIAGVNKAISMMMPNQNFTQSFSPLSVSPNGQKIVEALKLDSAIEQNWNKISTAITTETNPYDIQVKFITEFGVNFEKYLDEETANKVKLHAYANGVALIEYARMLGVMARDRYFKEHNIDVADIDKNDPNNQNT